MRSLPTLILLLCALITPARAQESGALAAAAPAPTEAAQMAIWCGAAFAVLAKTAAADGPVSPADYEAKAEAAFGVAAAELIQEGMSIEQFRAMAEHTAADVTAPFREQNHTEAECDAILPSAPAQ